MSGMMARLKELAIRFARIQINPCSCGWVGPLGCLILSAGIVGLIYAVFIPRDPLTWTWRTIFLVAYCADLAVAAATGGVWGILRQLSQRVRQSRTANRIVEGLLTLLALVSIVLLVFIVLAL